METITAWRTKDKKIFDIKTEAKKHEKKLLFEESIRTVLIAQDISSNDVDTLFEIIVENKEVMKKILNGDYDV